MSQNIEDILSGDNPKKDLEKVPEGKSKNMGYRIINILREYRYTPMNTYSKEQLWGRIEHSVLAEKQTTVPRGSVARLLKWSVAASLILMLSYFAWDHTTSKPTMSPLIEAAMNNRYTFEEDQKVSLHGTDRPLSVDENQEILDVSSFGGDQTIGKAESFITLSVPYGKRMEVILPDNSKVWVNAGSQLTFPKKFDEDKREVYLEGEAFFDITSADAGTPFFVETTDMRIKVLGTTFNVSSYQEDSFSSTVLLSGKIELQGTENTPFEARVLEPGSAAVLNRESRSLLIRKEKAEDHMSWTNKQLILKNDPLPDILVRLERVYNTKIIVEDGTVKGEDTFSGRLDLSQPLTNLLISLYNPKEYIIEKEERRITITRR